MDRELLIAAGPGEWRAALLEDGVPVELFVERGDRNEAGSLHLGRVCRIEPALAAVLVDIGGDRPAFLPQAEVVPRGKRLHEGERVVVQILREAQSGKAARVTMGVRLRGRSIELIVGRTGLDGGEALVLNERSHLLAALETLTERSEAGEGAAGLRLVKPAPIEEMTAEAAPLVQRWRDILDRAARLDPPARVDPVVTFAAALASAVPARPTEILIDEPGAIPEIRAAFPEAVIGHRPEAEWSIDLDAVFDQALSETVVLPGGGSVHVETTRAAVLIDVDSGTPATGPPERAGLAANLAAAAVIARQVRLRNLGGGIVVDLVGLDKRGSRERVRAALAAALAADPRAPQVLGWTRLGHLELVRPRRGRPLAEALLETRPGGALVKTAATVAYQALRQLRREARTQPGRSWRLVVAPDVATALAEEARDPVQEAERRFARKIAIETNSGYDRERFQIATP